MQKRLKLRQDGARAWLLADASTGDDIGGVQYEHAPDGNHYQPWVLVDDVRPTLEHPLPQLAMAARCGGRIAAVEVIRKPS